MAKRTRARQHASGREYPRTARLNQLFQEILADELERHDDERLELVTVMSVAVDADLSRAVVYYDSPAGADDDEVVQEALVEARGRLQRSIASQARVKRTPELVFRPDDVGRSAARVEEVLRNLRHDGPAAE